MGDLKSRWRPILELDGDKKSLLLNFSSFLVFCSPDDDAAGAASSSVWKCFLILSSNDALELVLELFCESDGDSDVECSAVAPAEYSSSPSSSSSKSSSSSSSISSSSSESSCSSSPSSFCLLFSSSISVPAVERKTSPWSSGLNSNSASPPVDVDLLVILDDFRDFDPLDDFLDFDDFSDLLRDDRRDPDAETDDPDDGLSSNASTSNRWCDDLDVEVIKRGDGDEGDFFRSDGPADAGLSICTNGTVVIDVAWDDDGFSNFDTETDDVTVGWTTCWGNCSCIFCSSSERLNPVLDNEWDMILELFFAFFCSFCSSFLDLVTGADDDGPVDDGASSPPVDCCCCCCWCWIGSVNSLAKDDTGSAPPLLLIEEDGDEWEEEEEKHRQHPAVLMRDDVMEFELKAVVVDE